MESTEVELLPDGEEIPLGEIRCCQDAGHSDVGELEEEACSFVSAIYVAG